MEALWLVEWIELCMAGGMNGSILTSGVNGVCMFAGINGSVHDWWSEWIELAVISYE